MCIRDRCAVSAPLYRKTVHGVSTLIMLENTSFLTRHSTPVQWWYVGRREAKRAGLLGLRPGHRRQCDQEKKPHRPLHAFTSRDFSLPALANGAVLLPHRRRRHLPLRHRFDLSETTNSSSAGRRFRTLPSLTAFKFPISESISPRWSSPHRGATSSVCAWRGISSRRKTSTSCRCRLTRPHSV